MEQTLEHFVTTVHLKSRTQQPREDSRNQSAGHRKGSGEQNFGDQNYVGPWWRAVAFIQLKEENNKGLKRCRAETIGRPHAIETTSCLSFRR